MLKKARITKKGEETEWLDALELINKLVYHVTGEGLSEAQILVLRCAWDGKKYREISSQKHDYIYLQNVVAPKLWQLLSLIFSRQIFKKDIRTFFANASIANHQNMFEPLKIVGGDLPNTKNFYGRKEELLKLKHEILQQKLIILIGETGMGKSLLAAKLIEDISQQPTSKFDVVVWKPIVYSLSAEELVNNLLEILKLKTDFEKFHPKLNYLINQLRKQRCLIILDGFENILSQPKNKEGYIKLFRRFVEEGYETSFLLTSRVSFQEFPIFSNIKSVKHIQVGGLDNVSAMRILENKGVRQPEEEEAKRLIEQYQGNPASIEELGEKIKHYFGGSIQQYLNYQTTMIGERLQVSLHQHFGQPDSLNSLQRSIMIYIAENLSAYDDKEVLHQSDNFIKITNILDFFKEKLGEKVSNGELFSALKELEIKLLIQRCEDDNYEICYTLQPGVKKYIINDPLGLVRNNPNFKIVGV